MKVANKAYLAGLIDGEGCISICRRKHKQKKSDNWYYEPQVIIANTDKRMVDFAIDLCGGWVAIPKKIKDHHKQQYHWKITGDDMRQLLSDVLPYLILKKKQAEIVLSFPNYQHERRNGRTKEELDKQENLWREMKQLNCKGMTSVVTGRVERSVNNGEDRL